MIANGSSTKSSEVGNTPVSNRNEERVSPKVRKRAVLVGAILVGIVLLLFGFFLNISLADEPMSGEVHAPSSKDSGESVSTPVAETTLGDGQNAGEKQTLRIKGVDYTFCWCPAGSFMMGSPETEEGRRNDETQHLVTLSRGYWMLETAVTQEMWKSIMGFNPSAFKGTNLPVEFVSWYECNDFIRDLNATGVIPEGWCVILPSEAQWEYACRAGTDTPYSFGSVLNGNQANCNGNYPYGTGEKGRYIEEPTTVKSYEPNAWGLYDMHGNVWEWCFDRYNDYPTGSVTDPTEHVGGSDRVYRGGSWDESARHCRSAYRFRFDPAYRFDNLGFRVALARRP